VVEWSITTGCKPVGFGLRRFESSPAHTMEPSNPWKMVFKGDLLAIEKHEKKGFERAVRAPGVRLILKNDKDEFLLTKEFRSEINAHDYRLPGGKVLDSLTEFLAIRDNPQELERAAERAARLEAKQETGVDEIHNLTLLTKSGAGASVSWDLYYFTGNIGAMSEQELEEDERERGIEVGFYTKENVLEMLKSGEIGEARTIGVLFKYLLS
jgi:8-oxo-dGTP pyrophosphatase MutT (NUDIX family)